MKLKGTPLLLVFLIGFIAPKNSLAQDSDEQEDGFWNSIFEYISTDKRNYDGYSKYKHFEENIYRVLDFEGSWKFQIGDNEKWSRPDLDDQRWEDIHVPAGWENEGFHGYDGFAWYRIHFDGRQLKRNEAHYLVLGFIDDVDETYLNGMLVGRTGRFPPRYRTAYNSNRQYFLSNELINFEGENVVAVKVFDEYKNGGIVKGRPGIYISEGSESLVQNLYGAWKFTKKNSKSYSEPSYNDEDWDVLLVPGYWDNQGYRSFDGTAWYRKTFKLNFEPDIEENYYLVLGKIDDFDVTYLNGQIIGETSDREALGQSQSYQKIRVYEIPEGLLSLRDKNVIAVKVRDIGIDGGIYNGPIGIVSGSDVTKMIRKRD